MKIKRILIMATGLLLAGNLFVSRAQTPDSLELRRSIIAEARYLKSIYKADEAMEKLAGLIRQDVFDEEVLSELADCHFQNGSYESAGTLYSMLSSRSPENILYRLKQMQSFYRLKSYSLAIQTGRSILQKDSIPAVISLTGDAFSQMDQPDSALWFYRRAIALRPGNERTVTKALQILLYKKEYDDAISVAGDFLAENPDNTSVTPLQGLAFYRKGDYKSAIRVYQRQVDIGNDIYPVHYYLGQSYWNTKDYRRADEELLAAWQIDSTDVNLAYSIAALRSDASLFFDRDIKPWLDKAWDMVQPDPSMMYRLHRQYATGYYAKENMDKAITHFKEAYRYNPKYISALSSIAYCYEFKKEYKAALEWYEKYLALTTPGSKGYDFAMESIAYIKGKLFMEVDE